MKYRELIKKLKKAGCKLDRQAKGSHEIWKSKTGLIIIVPNHGSKEIPHGTCESILKSAKGG